MASQKLQIDLSGRAGLAPNFYGDVSDSSGNPQLRYLSKPGQMAQGTFNPIRKYGYLAPVPSSFTTVSETSGAQNFTNEFRAIIYDAINSQVFAAENGDLLWGTTAASLTSWVGATAGSPITGSVLHFTDLEFYQLNGARTIFAPYMKSGGGDILKAVVNTDGTLTSVSATWFSASCSGGGNTGATSDVFIVSCDNNLAYILDKFIIYELDGTTNGGTNGTATTVIEFSPSITCVDAIDYRGNLLVAIQSAPSYGANSVISAATDVVGVYFWDRDTSTSSVKDFIPMAGVREIRKIYKTYDGYVRAIVISSEDKVQIRHFSGSSFDVIEELSSNAYPPYRDSFTYSGPFATWLGYDGFIYAHGRVSQNDPEGLFIIGDTTTEMGASPVMGAMIAIDNSSNRVGLLWSGKTNGGTVKNRYLYPHASGSNPLSGDAYTMVTMMPELSTVHDIFIYCAPTVTSDGTTIATVSVYTNMKTGANYTISHAVTKAEASRGFIKLPINKAFCNSVQIKISWATGTTIGTDDFLPMYADVFYTPTYSETGSATE